MNQHETTEEIDKEAKEEFLNIKCIFYGLVFGIWIMGIIAFYILL